MKKRALITLYSLFIFSNLFAQEWFKLGTGLIGSGQYDQVNTLCNDTAHNRLWAAGIFQIAGSDSVHNVAWWDGVQWHPMQFVVYNGDTLLYGGDEKITSSIMFHGKFVFSIDKSTAFNRWRIVELNEDSISYKWIGSFNKDIHAMCVYHDTLYVAGEFTNYQAVPAVTTTNISRIAKWNGTDFVPVGNGIGTGIVYDLCVYNDKLIAAGYFQSASGTYCKNIAAWDGSSWSAIGNGLGQAGNFDVTIKSVCPYKGKLFAGGDYNQIYFGNDLAVWNGINWSGAGGAFQDVWDMKEINNKLYVGADYCLNAQIPWYNFAMFNDTTWFLTGKGPKYSSYGTVRAIEEWNDSIYVGGGFKYIGDTPLVYVGFVARFDTSPLPGVNINGTNSLCFNTCSGTAMANTTGLAPFSYQWSNGATTQSINGLCPNNYYVTATDNNGVAAFDTVIITEPSEIIITDTSTNASCATCNTGMASVTASGGLAPLSYAWNNGDTTAIINNQLQGTYTVVVTDNNGCAITDTIKINYNALAQITGQNSLCFATCTGSATATSNGVTPFIYQWSNGETTQSINGLCPDNYYITVTDSNGVAANDTVTITEPPQLLITDTSTNASCATCSNGTATINASGGVVPMSYEWSNGATTSTINNQLPDTYTVVVTDSNGCVVNDTVTIGFDVGISSQGKGGSGQLVIYPNPVKDEFRVSCSGFLVGDAIVISNLLGVQMMRLIRTDYSSINDMTIDISKLPQGIYLLHIQTNDGWQVGKVVKE